MAFTISPSLSLLFFVFMEFLCSYSMARTFYVGGDDGWKLHPSRNYNELAKKYRFLINDTLVFKYQRGHDSVLVVNHNDYSKCNKENPIRVLPYSRSIFRFEKSGPFFFISGHDQNCEKGEKLHIVVISPNHRNLKSPPRSPVAKTPTHASPVKSPSVSPSPTKAPKHTPRVNRPSHSPSPTTRTPPAKTPSPAAKTPTNAPLVKSPPSAKTPAHAPSVKSPSHSPATKIPTHSPHVHTPSHSPSPKAESPKNHHGAAHLSPPVYQPHHA